MSGKELQFKQFLRLIVDAPGSSFPLERNTTTGTAIQQEVLSSQLKTLWVGTPDGIPTVLLTVTEDQRGGAFFPKEERDLQSLEKTVHGQGFSFCDSAIGLIFRCHNFSSHAIL